MEEEVYQWNPYKGLGNISFYFSELELVNLLGKPNELVDEERVKHYHYRNLAVIVSFICSADKHTTMQVQVSSKEIFLKEKRLHLLSFRQLISQLRQHFVTYTGVFADGHPAPSEKIIEYKRMVFEQGSTQKVQYTFPYLGAIFWYENGRMINSLVHLPQPFSW